MLVKFDFKRKMEILNQTNNTNDKLTLLIKEAEELKLKLHEEREKLNDTTCKSNIDRLFFFYLKVNL